MCEDKLKLCPFCGSHAKIFPQSHISNNKDCDGEWAVVCQNEEALCNVRLLYCNSREEAIQQWNRRVDAENAL